MKISPCKDCAQRHVKCHAECAAYAEFAKEREEVRQKRLKSSEEQWDASAGIRRTMAIKLHYNKRNQ